MCRSLAFSPFVVGGSFDETGRRSRLGTEPSPACSGACCRSSLGARRERGRGWARVGEGQVSVVAAAKSVGAFGEIDRVVGVF